MGRIWGRGKKRKRMGRGEEGGRRDLSRNHGGELVLRDR